jgi:DNA-directed RNA polymerase specialized sigma24 family protein
LAVKGRPTEPYPPHRVLREVYRHYLEYRDLVTSPNTITNDEGHSASSVNCDHGVIEYGYFTYEDDGTTVKDKIQITLSFWDLHGALQTLSKRKREAVFYNVILDWKQRDVARVMKITTVSVGQYVEQAMLQLSEKYFAEQA